MVATINHTTADDVIPITDDDLRLTIDREARRRLGISGEDFLSRLKRHDLPDSAAVSDIAVLARFLDD